MAQVRLFVLMALAVAVWPLSAQAQGPFGLGGSDTPLVERFDTNKDGFLDAAERKAARAFMERQSRGGPFGGGRGGFPAFRGRGFAPASPGVTITPSEVKAAPAGAALYDIGTLRTAFIQFEADDWETELSAFYRTDVDVPATVIVDGRTYRNVGVHFRGMSSFAFVPPGSKRSLNLAFDFRDSKQALNGYRTLNLLNANGDPTFVRPVLYATIARKYIPAPAANYMHVVINGENWGVYVNAEQFNRDFLQETFKTTAGEIGRAHV